MTFAMGASACGGGETASGGGTTGNGLAPSLLGVSDTVRRQGDVCTVYEGNAGCPPDVMCNPPPPRPVTCPSTLTRDGSIVRHEDGSCLLILDRVCVTGPMPTCNPPPPQRVPCNDAHVADGLQQRHSDGACYEHAEVSCPRPTETCEPAVTQAVACPDPETPAQ